MAKLVTTAGPNRGTDFKLVGKLIVVGRHEQSGIVLADRRASRRHAKIEVMGDRYFIEDMGSRNGTLVNSIPVSRRELKEGDEITICDTKFLFRAEAVAKPKPSGAMLASDLGGGSGTGLRKSMVTFMLDPADEKPQLSAVMDASAFGGPGASGNETAQTARAKKSLRAIWTVANALVTIHDLQQVLEEVMNVLFKIFPQVDRGFVMLKSGNGDELEAKVIRSRKAKPGEAVEIKISSGVVNEVMRSRKAVLSSDAASDDRFSDRLSIVNLQICSMMAAPLVVRDEILGLISIDTSSAQGAFTEEDLEVLTSIGPQVAIAIKNAQLIKEVEAEAEKRSGLARYVSPDIAELIMQNKLDIAVGIRHGTAFFSDIIGFTRMSESMKPQDVVDRLNRYFHVMEEIIFRHGGTVDKFGGDSIMAFWGVLVPKDSAPTEAVSAAVEMQNALFAFNYELGGDLKENPLRMGIGLNTGDLVAGPLGSDKKVEFTVIGDTVNTAQRIESKAGRGQVFVSLDTYKEISHAVSAVKLPPVEVKNKSGPVQMYSVRAVKPPTGALEGVVTCIPVELNGATQQNKGTIVWARSAPGKIVMDICAKVAPKTGEDIELNFKMVELPTIPALKGKVIAARNTTNSGSALVEVNAPPEAVLSFLSPGHVVTSPVSIEDLVRS